jgi:hypothetical protein
MRFQEFGKGVYPKSKLKPLAGSNISQTGTHVARFQRKKNIEPGTDRWFKLWFAKPGLTGENPYKV